MTEPEAWLAFVTGCRAWADHLEQWDKIKFATPHGPVYVSIMRGTNTPASFDEVNEAGDVIAPGRKRATPATPQPRDKAIQPEETMNALPATQCRPSLGKCEHPYCHCPRFEYKRLFDGTYRRVAVKEAVHAD